MIIGFIDFFFAAVRGILISMKIHTSHVDCDSAGQRPVVGGLAACLVAGWLLVSLVGCGRAPKIYDTDRVIVTREQVVDMLADGGKPTVLIDVRSPEQYAAGHIPSAINIPLIDIRANDRRLANATNLIVYGSSQQAIIPAAASKKLLALGYENVHEYQAGIEDWK